MIKPLLGVAATGVVAVLAWKLLVIVMLPLVGLAIGVVAFMIKAAFLLLILLISYWIYRRMSRDDSATA
jgi:hypothetical protein